MLISETSVRRPVFATMVIAALIVFGLISIGNIPLNLMPEVDFPIVTVQSILPGADPETVEIEVSDKIEEAVNTIEGIDQVRSTSLEGVSLVVIEFALEKDVDIAVQDVRDKLAGIRQELPDQLEEPLVEKLDLGAIPVITLAVYSNNPSQESEGEEIRRVTEFSKKYIKERLQSITGVGNVTMIGGQEREIRIWLNADRMRAYSIPIDLVRAVLRSENVEIPGGRIETQQSETVVKTHGDIETIEEFNNLVVAYRNGSPVRLRDIGYAEDGMEDLRSISFLDGRRAVSLEVRKVSGGNVVAVADRVKQEIELIKKILPEDIEVRIALDNSSFIREAVDDVTNQMIIGGILAVLTILFFLRNFRTAFIAAIVLPTSVISTFTFLNALGFSLNQLTMLALTISIGMLIDDAVVMIENIYHKLEHGELDTKKAAITAAKEIGLAIITTSMTLMGVFVPVAFMTGIIGRFFYEFGLTVAIAVVISTFTSLTLTPMISSRMLKGKREPKHNFIYMGITRFLRALDGGYRALLASALRHRVITVAIAVAVFWGSLQLAGLIPGEFMPPFDEGHFVVSVETPEGSSIQETQRAASEVEKWIRNLPGVDFIFTSIGGGAQGKVTEATLMIEMVPLAERSFSQIEMQDATREYLAQNLPDAKIAVAELTQMGGGAFSNYQINYSLRGTDLDQLVNAAETIKNKIESIPGFVDVDTSFEAGKPEVGIRINREKAADLGVSVGSVAFAINSLIGGEDVTTFQSGGEQFDVRVRLLAQDRDDPRDIERVLVMTKTGGTAELGNLVKVSEGTGPVQINRRNRMREVQVLANLTGELQLGTAVNIINETSAEMNLPVDIISEHVGMAEIMQESFESMGFSLFLAIIIIYMVLASLFESFVHPFTIMMSLPLSIAGALGLLLIAGKTLSIMSMIGIIMLMGLVTKNAILLIDYTIRLRNQGKSRLDALLEAGPRRLRPILMTTISTIAGSIPVALGIGAGAAFRSSMGVTVIGGMITSTLLTLVVVPVVYTFLDDIGRLRLPAWIAFWRKPRKAEDVIEPTGSK